MHRGRLWSPAGLNLVYRARQAAPFAARLGGNKRPREPTFVNYLRPLSYQGTHKSPPFFFQLHNCRPIATASGGSNRTGGKPGNVFAALTNECEEAAKVQSSPPELTKDTSVIQLDDSVSSIRSRLDDSANDITSWVVMDEVGASPAANHRSAPAKSPRSSPAKKSPRAADANRPRHASSLPNLSDSVSKTFAARGFSRSWSRLTREAVQAPDGFQFSVCSYNVLSQVYADTCGYLYRHASASELSWEGRWPLLRQELALLNADIFCLQEVEALAFAKYFKPALAHLGYDGAFKQKSQGKTDGCALFWRRAVFGTAVTVEELDLRHPGDGGNRILDHPQVGLIASFQPPDGSGRFLVATTHLIFNPGRGDVKLAQLAFLFAALDRSAWNEAKGERDPLIFVGDLNLEPLSPLYNFIVAGELTYAGRPRRELSGQGKRGGPLLPRSDLLPLSLQIAPSGAFAAEEARRSESGGAEIVGSPAPQRSRQEKSFLGYDRSDGGRLRHPLCFLSAYRHREEQSGELEVSTAHRDIGNVDYIFFSVRDKRVRWRLQEGRETMGVSGVKEGGLHCIASYSLPGQSFLKATVGFLPNRHCGSDHLPLVSLFRRIPD